jgi:hypothetical protein
MESPWQPIQFVHIPLLKNLLINPTSLCILCLPSCQMCKTRDWRAAVASGGFGTPYNELIGRPHDQVEMPTDPRPHASIYGSSNPNTRVNDGHDWLVLHRVNSRFHPDQWSVIGN